MHLTMIFRLLLVLAVLASGAWPVLAQQSDPWGYTVTIEGRPPNQTTNVTITNYYGPGGSVVVPEQIDGKTVRQIGNGSAAIDPQARLTGIVIPGTVTTIASYAFRRGTNLTSVTLGHGVVKVGYNTFGECGNLQAIHLPDSVTELGDYAFHKGTNLVTATLSSGLTNIGVAMFSECRSLTEVVIPPAVTRIGDYAFANGTALTNVVIPYGVTNIGQYAFGHCRSLTRVVIPDSVHTIGRNAFASCFDMASIDLGQGLTNIDYAALIYCDSLTTVTLPDSLSQLPADLLYNSVNLVSVIVGSGVTGIGDEAFGDCGNLASILFRGAPPMATGTNQNIFGNSTPEIFVEPGTTGWGTLFAGRPVQPFEPEPVLTGFSQGAFAFAWTGTGRIPMDVQRRTSLVSGSWSNIATGVADGAYVDEGTPAGGAYYRAVLP